MATKNSNFQVTQLLEASTFATPRSDFNEYGSFIYKDHVTRLKYDVHNLKKTNTVHKQNLNQSNSNKQNHQFTHKSNKSLGSMMKIKKEAQKDEMQTKKWQISHFLQQLVMMNRIRNKRNYIVSGNQKVQKRRSILPFSLPEITKKNRYQQSIDLLKQEVRNQVNSLNTQLFRDYLSKSQPYRHVFGQLNDASNKGALNTNKIKEIKQKIKQCTKKINDTNTDAQTIIKKSILNGKENQIFDRYFDGVWKELDQQIHLKIKHQASFNWKHGRKSTLDQIIDNYGHERNVSLKN